MIEDEIRLNFQQSIRSATRVWYRAIQPLGRGGNATTWLVVATSGDHRGIPFAIKIFRKVSAPQRRKSFLEEIEFLEEVDHPSILRIYDRGVFYDRHPFVVMEYMPKTLADAIRSDNLRLVQKLSLMCQLISGLHFLAGLERPIIHRDIKPANIFLKSSSVVIGDFGMLKRIDELPEDDSEWALKESTPPGMPYRYRTPDLVAYAKDEYVPDCRSDIFQLGLVAAELFTGWNPQIRVERDQMLDPVRCDSVKFIRGAKGGVIRHLITQMLQDDRDQRPSTQSLVDQWLGLFDTTSETQLALEGTVF